MRDLLTIFTCVFLAELGDKTQLATLTFAAQNRVSPVMVFVLSSAALVLSCAIATLLGGVAGRHLSGAPLKIAAGSLFVAIGIWTIVQGLRG
jgi:putative Ca2+/H+ antiporter (TMEM165/GDT1 family)